VQTEQVDGRLGYGAARTIGGGPDGVITALPAEGSVIDRGGTLWEVDGAPGPALLFGDKPMWRNLSSGVEKGEDIRQLEENLVALGFADANALTVDDKYTSATATAVKKWQKARGVEQTGRVATTDVVFSTGPVRVSALKVAVGDRGAAAAVLEVTGSEQIVTVKLDTSKASVAKQDDAVTIKLTDGRTINGTVRSVGTVVHSDTSGNQTSNYLDVVVALADGQSAGLDDAPVTVNFTRSSATDVLAVPVRALLALAEGGYAVERVAGATTELVPVTLGAFADGYVQITGNVADGDTVVVA
jgi:peptidoglycan hydrolase-like protein with peptidoglycan-binding domain